MTAWQYRDADGRVCATCKDYKAWDQFGIYAHGPDGHRSRCKDCRKEIEKSYKRDPDKQRANAKRWYDKHRRK